MNLAQQVSTGLASAALAVAVTQSVGTDWIVPRTGHQHTQTATALLARVKAILTGVEGSALTPKQRADFWNKLVGLEAQRGKLGQAYYESILYSIFRTCHGRLLEARSDLLLKEVETASSHAFAEQAMQRALEETLAGNTSPTPARPLAITPGPSFAHGNGSTLTYPPKTYYGHV